MRSFWLTEGEIQFITDLRALPDEQRQLIKQTVLRLSHALDEPILADNVVQFPTSQ